jgi:hypothetical protein
MDERLIGILESVNVRSLEANPPRELLPFSLILRGLNYVHQSEQQQHIMHTAQYQPDTFVLEHVLKPRC